MSSIHARAFAGGQVWSEADIRDLLDQPTVQAVFDDRHGFALFRVLPPEAELLTIAIDPAVQHQGRGRALLASGLSDLAASGVNAVFLDVAEDNTAARALYARLGFEEVSRRPAYYRRDDGARVDALVLQRSTAAEKSIASDGH